MGDLEPRAVGAVDPVAAVEPAPDDPGALWDELDDRPAAQG
jgi:hypothetical protein